MIVLGSIALRVGCGMLFQSLTPPAPLALEAEIQEPSDEAASTSSVVFMSVPELDEEAQREATSAMSAQLNGISVRLIVRDAGLNSGASLRARIERAIALAAEEDATAVFWLESDERGELLHYTVEPARGDRALVRRTGTQAESRSAQIEVVAALTRRSTAVLLRGGTIGVGYEEVRPTPPTAEPKAEPAPPSREPPDEAPRRGHARIAMAYSATTFAPEAVLAHGLNLRGGWRFDFGLLLDAGYTFTLPTRTALEGVEIQVERHPVEIALGYRRAWPRIALEGELAGIFDSMTRRTTSAAAGLVATDRSTRLLLGLAPRLRLEVRPTPVFSLFAAAAMPVFPGTFAYVGDLPSRTPFLSPWRVRAQFRAGLAFSI